MVIIIIIRIILIIRIVLIILVLDMIEIMVKISRVAIIIVITIKNNNNDSYSRIRIGTIRKMRITVITSIEEKSVSGNASRKLDNKPSSMFGVSVFVISGTQAIEPHGL